MQLSSVMIFTPGINHERTRHGKDATKSSAGFSRHGGRNLRYVASGPALNFLFAFGVEHTRITPLKFKP